MLWLMTICAGLNFAVGNTLLGSAFVVGQLVCLVTEAIDLVGESREEEE